MGKSKKKNFFKLFLAKVRNVNRITRDEKRKVSPAKALGERRF